MTVQELYDHCENPEFTEIFVWSGSSLGYMPAKYGEYPDNDSDVFLDYI